MNYITDRYSDGYPTSKQSEFNGPLSNITITSAADGYGHDSVLPPPVDTGSGYWKSIVSWSSNADFSRWSDGTSNQLLCGERNIPAFAREGNEFADRTQDKEHMWNPGGCVSAGFRPETQPARFIGPLTLLARGPNDQRLNALHEAGENLFAQSAGDYTANSIYENFGFGSDHTAVIQFAFGDGSIHAFNAETSVRGVVWPMSQVDDGESVSAP